MSRTVRQLHVSVYQQKRYMLFGSRQQQWTQARGQKTRDLNRPGSVSLFTKPGTRRMGLPCADSFLRQSVFRLAGQRPSLR